MPISDHDHRRLISTRVTEPEAFSQTLKDRERPDRLVPSDGRLFLIAADHTARGSNSVGDDALAMSNRRDLLGRLIVALEDPGSDGIMASADILEELAVLTGVDGSRTILDAKVVVGTLNRGGLAGSSWELDDRHTAYSAAHIASAGLDGGKMLLRIHDTDSGTKNTLELCARYVGELADRALMALVEPLPYGTDAAGRHVLIDSTERLIRCVGVANGLGHTSSYTWLKLPATVDVEQVMAATTLPCLILGGAPGSDSGSDFAAWDKALSIDNVVGLTVGRRLLYPPDGDVAGAVATASRIVHG